MAMQVAAKPIQNAAAIATSIEWFSNQLATTAQGLLEAEVLESRKEAVGSLKEAHKMGEALVAKLRDAGDTENAKEVERLVKQIELLVRDPSPDPVALDSLIRETKQEIAVLTAAGKTAEAQELGDLLSRLTEAHGSVEAAQSAAKSAEFLEADEAAAAAEEDADEVA